MRRFVTALLFSLIVGAGLTACEREGPMEQAGENVDQAAENASDAAEDATNN